MTGTPGRVGTEITDLTARNATLADLVGMLRTQHVRKLDVTAPAGHVRAVNGNLVLTDTEVHLDEDGVTPQDGTYRPTEDCDAGIADRLGIPTKYIRRLRTERPDLYDSNVNGWLHGWSDELAAAFPQINPNPSAPIPGDPRTFLVRCFKGDNGGVGVARAFLSDRYGIIDHLDVLFASLDGIADAGVNVDIASCDLSERRMYVKVTAPQIQAYAPALLEGYRSPFDGRQVGHGWTPERVAQASRAEGKSVGDEPPVVFAGFVLSNSETGLGSWSITPQIQVRVCNNGLTITADALRGVHLGGKLDPGVIRWSKDTERKHLALVTAKTRDAVATFLDVEYVQAKVAELEEKALVEIENPQKVIETVSKALTFSETQQDAILSHFIRGGQMTAGGVMQAVTSAAQSQRSADAAYAMAAVAVRALELAAAAS